MQRSMPRKNRKHLTLSLRALLALFAVGGAVLYALTVATPLFNRPHVLLSPVTFLPSGVTVIAGNTANVSTLTVNGVETPLQEDGTFAIERSFPPGYTVVVIRASDRFSRTEEYLSTFVSPPLTYGTKEKNDPEERQ